MPIPENVEDLKAMGYVYDNDATCRGCGAPIEWWITPRGKKMPMSVIDEGTLQTGRREVRRPHWGDCPNAKDFKR